MPGRRTHPHTPQDRLYTAWCNMLRRVRGRTRKADYFDRGITVCEEWGEFSAFRDWALGHGYTSELTLDRIDNNGNYTPENCRWATTSQQMRNTRRNHLITHDGETRPLAEWCQITGLKRITIDMRIRRGWPEDRLLLPVETGRILLPCPVELQQRQRGEAHYASRLTGTQVAEIRRRYAEGGTSYPKLGREFGVTASSIGAIIKGKYWKHS